MMDGNCESEHDILKNVYYYYYVMHNLRLFVMRACCVSGSSGDRVSD